MTLEKMTTLNVSKARTDLYRLIDQVVKSHKPIMISGRRANGVLISQEDWSAIQETLFLLGIPDMRKSIKVAISEPLSRGKSTIKW